LKKFPILPYILLPTTFFSYSIIIKNYSKAFNSLTSTVLIIVIYFFTERKNIFKKDSRRLIFIFILLSLFGGNSLNLYHIIPYWDRILHFLSGFIIAKIGFEIYNKIEKNIKNKKLISLFALLFSISCACVWEIYEFFSDILFKTNAQNNSLNDTMWDIILGISSAILYLFMPKIKKEKN